MSHTYGRCLGSETRQLPPQKGLPPRYLAGPFVSEMTATIRTKLRGEAPEQLFIGLLTGRPTRTATTTRNSSRLAMNARLCSWSTAIAAPRRHAVCFHIPLGGALESHVGLFDAKGELRFYGRLMSTRERDVPATLFEFRPYALSVIRLRS